MTSEINTNLNDLQNLYQTLQTLQNQQVLQNSNINNLPLAKTQAEKLVHTAAVGVADYYTGGIAGRIDQFAQKQWPGTYKRMMDAINKYDPGTIAMNKYVESGMGMVDSLFKGDFKNLLSSGIEFLNSSPAAFSTVAQNIGRKLFGDTGGKVARAGVALCTGGLSELGAQVKKLFNHKSTKEYQAEAFQRLASAGIKMHSESFELTGAQKEERKLIEDRQAKDFVGYDHDGNFINNAFKNTADLKYLRPEDLQGQLSFYERFGNDWLGTFSEADRYKICQAAIDAQALSSEKGMIKVDWGKIDFNQVLAASSSTSATNNNHEFNF